jgi:hypothetical protein
MHILLCIWRFTYTYTRCGPGAQGRQKRASDPLKLKLQTVVSYHVWVLGTKPGSSPNIASALNYWAISLWPCYVFLVLWSWLSISLLIFIWNPTLLGIRRAILSYFRLHFLIDWLPSFDCPSRDNRQCESYSVSCLCFCFSSIVLGDW